MLLEANLIEKSKKGDPEAFSELIRRYEDRIFRMASHVCVGLPAEAEDVYQETFLTAFKKIVKFRGGSNLGTWLYRIAANNCWMRFRQKKKAPFVPLLDGRTAGDHSAGADARDWASNPEEAAKKKELREAVTGALSELSVEYRLVLTLRDIEGLSNEETAKIMKLSVPAVKSRVHRGRMFLRGKLDAYFDGRARG